MPLTVKWADGININYKNTSIIFDPQSWELTYNHVFITHAHQDHAKGFDFLNQLIFSTPETFDLINAFKRKEKNWKPIRYGQRMKIDDLEVEAHNAGHILGSTQYEVISSEGNLVYTGDLNFVDTMTTKAADVIPCDILVLEATFGSPELVFPPYERISLDIIQWALNSIKQGKIPAFQADTIGNAQELIKIFNTQTKIPVIAHWQVTKINEVYKSYGHDLDYIDSRSEEAEELASSRKCVFIAPKGLRGLTDNEKFNVAYVSGWATHFKGRRKPFLLSDHADFNKLLEFVKQSKPKLVLLCYGGRYNKIFGEIVNKRLGIEARPLSLIPTTMIFEREKPRILACEREILRAIKIPGFLYSRKWIMSEVSKSLRNFTVEEINEALDILTKRGILRIVNDNYESR